MDTHFWRRHNHIFVHCVYIFLLAAYGAVHHTARPAPMHAHTALMEHHDFGRDVQQNVSISLMRTKKAAYRHDSGFGAAYRR